MKRKYHLIGTVILAATLAACSSGTKAPIGSAGGGSGSYVVKRGDTLYSIAKRHNMTLATLKKVNNLSDPNQLEVGQRLVVSGAGGGQAGNASAAASTPTSAAKATQPTRAADANKISWDWPVRGKVIQNYSDSTRGIDIEGKVGDTVKVAADGTVSYVGNGLRGLGNLVLVTHSSGFITAYAHNSKIVVKTSDRVKKGQKIAELGQSDTSSPRLHFEIRRNGSPVNPLSYLPK